MTVRDPTLLRHLDGQGMEQLVGLLEHAQAVAVALFRSDGSLAAASPGFERIADGTDARRAGEVLQRPGFAELYAASAQRGTAWAGPLTLGPPQRPGRAFRGLAVHVGSDLLLVAEADVDALERLTSELIDIQAELHEMQRAQFRSAAELRRAERRYRSLEEHNPDGVLRADPKGRVLAANPAAVRLLGRSEAELEGRDLAELFEPPGWLAEASEAARREGAARFALTGHDASGGAFATSATLVPAGGTGATEALFLLVRDETERLRAEEEVRELNAELEARVADRTARLEASYRELAEFSYLLSHHLRAPARAVSGHASLLEQQLEAHLGDEERRRLAGIQAAAGRMGRLVDTLVAASQLGRRTIAPERIVLRPLLEGLAREVGAGPGGATLELAVADLPDVLGDHELLALVFRELLANARRFARPGEPARVRVTWDPTARAYVVSDDGIGLPAEHADEAFRFFTRLHPDHEGSGVGAGLALVRLIVEKHDGRVRAEARADGGTTVALELPTADARS